MLKHFLNTFLRNTVKNKWFTVIIVSGLSLGLACSLTILLWVQHEMNYDSFHLKKERIYQVQQTVYLESQEYTADRTGGAYGPALLEGYPEVESFTRLGRCPEVIMSLPRDQEDKFDSYVESSVWAVDSTFLRIFSFKPLLGNLHNALNDRNSVVITKSVANKYFGEDWMTNPNVLGTSIRMNNEVDLVLTGILDDVPVNSNIQFEVLIHYSYMYDFGYNIDGFAGTMFHTYLLLHTGSGSEHLNESITEYIASQHEPDLESFQFIIPLKDVHLNDEQRISVFVYSFGIIGLLILIIACINYVNLSTAVGIKRAKEVGIRKVEGAQRYQLVFQFLGEAFILTVLSTQIAIILVELAIKEFNTLAHTNVSVTYSDPAFIISIAILILLTTLLAGTYPALVLSRQRPVQVLKGVKGSGKKGYFLRKFLVVTQFSITIFFIICTVITVRQFRFMDTADLGFSKENIVFVPLRGDQLDNYQAIRNELLRSSEITHVTSGSAVPDWVEFGEINWGNQPDNDNSALARILMTDYDFAETFNLEMVQGRFYSRDHASDSINSIVINEAIVDMLGYEDPVGQPFYLYGEEYSIIGVVNNFSFFPFNLGGDALIMPFRPAENLMFLKTVSGADESVMQYAEEVMANFSPQFPFEYYHMDEHQAPFMDNREEVNILMTYFSLFGIFISCLGLYGLTIHIAEQKTKEIGIRKAFGASVSGIMSLLSSGFIKLMLLANLIAIPFAYLTMNSALQFFTVRINLSIWIFLITGFATMLLAILTISGKSMQAARRNPIDSLRYE